MTSINSLLRPLVYLVLFFFGVFVSSFAGTFDTARLVPVGSGPSAVAVGDFNHDGNLDMVVANHFDSDLSVLLGNGNGTFKPQALIPLDGRPVAVVVGDFNGDGILDIAALTTDLFVLLGNGDGTFRVGGMFAVGASPTSLAVADFNHDGVLDLAVTEAGGVDVLLGKGNGTFKAAMNYPAGDGPVWVATGDFNGDGKVDLVVSDFDANYGFIGVSVLLGKGNGTFGSPIETGNLKAGGGNVVVGDFNADGKLDVVVGGLSVDSEDGMSIAVLFGDGTGKFNNPEYITTGMNPAFVATADFNGDNKPDLIAVNSLSGDVTVLLGNGKGRFVVGPNYAAGGGNPGVPAAAVGDFNGDGKPDLVLTSSATDDLSVLLNTGGGRFAAARDFRIPQIENFVTVGDFSHDGKEDLAVGFEPISILFGKGNGTFGPPVATNVSGAYPVTGDFTGDGFLDLATVVGDSVSVSLNKGDGKTFKAPKTYFVATNLSWLATGDFNNDGKLDLVVCDQQFIAVLLGNGDGTFQSPKYTAVSGSWELAVGDFNGDGKLDLAVTTTGSDVTILLGNGDGTFGKPHNFPAGGAEFPAIAVGDFNGDGKLDLAVAGVVNNIELAVSVLLGNGDGTFGKPSKRDVGAAFGGSMVIGDFNVDGKLDVVVSSAANTYVLLGNGDGTLKPATQIETGLTGGWMANGDFNGDGKPDVVVITAGGATILLNTSK
jgi:hypothetical protein